MSLRPQLHDGTFVFVSAPHGLDLAGLDVVATMREEEGLTLVISEEQALARRMTILFRAGWITLTADTALHAVGITAGFARALADAGIACNVIAGAHHDHLFVPLELAELAMQLLRGLQLEP